MLVLSRKVGERIVVPDCDLTITVVAVEGNKVRIGFSAPKEVAVFREEVWRQIDEDSAVLRPVQSGRPDRSDHPGRPRPASEIADASEPFFLTVYPHGDNGDNHEFDQD
jgi:carbon storage regulator